MVQIKKTKSAGCLSNLFYKNTNMKFTATATVAVALAAGDAVLALDNGLGATPGMGWNSDYCAGCKPAPGKLFLIVDNRVCCSDVVIVPR